MGRHRHVVNVRADGLAVVLGPLLSDARITAAALVDVDSGMVLDAWSAAGAVADPARPPDLELLGAQHAEVVRCALALLRSWRRADDAVSDTSGSGTSGPDTSGPDTSGSETCEVVLGAEGGPQHLLRTVPDPYGDRLALAVVVDGPPRVLDRVRKRLRSISVDALTAGPSMTRRPVLGGWSFAMPGPDVPARPARPEQRGRPEHPARPEHAARPEHPARVGADPSGSHSPVRDRVPGPPPPPPAVPAPSAMPALSAMPAPSTMPALSAMPAPSTIPAATAGTAPALSRLDVGRVELPGPRDGQPRGGPATAAPEPSDSSDPSGVAPGAPGRPEGRAGAPHLHPVRPDPTTGPVPAVAPPAAARRPGAGVPRPPSPPAALPAPAPPRARPG